MRSFGPLFRAALVRGTGQGYEIREVAFYRLGDAMLLRNDALNTLLQVPPRFLPKGRGLSDFVG